MLKWVNRTIAAILLVIAIGALIEWPFGASSNLDALHDLALDAEVWLVNHFESPALFILLVMISTLLLLPDMMGASNALPGPPQLHVTGPHLVTEDFERAIARSQLDAALVETLNLYRMTVTNRGSSPARNVKVLLLNITPRPRYEAWMADYPYPVGRTGKSTLRHKPCQIGPGAEETFNVISGWPNEEGMMFAAGLDTKSATWNPIPIDDDEQWTLTYEATSDNAEPIRFALTARVENMVLVLTVPSQSCPTISMVASAFP